VRKYVSDEASVKWLLRQRQAFFYNTHQLGEEEALEFEKAMAAVGSAEFQFYVGVHLGKASTAKAIPWFQRASRAGFVAADLWLGRSYEKLREGATLAADEKYRRLARLAYRQAALRGQRQATRGDPWAQLMIASQPDELMPWLASVQPRAANATRCASGAQLSKAYRDLFADDSLYRCAYERSK